MPRIVRQKGSYINALLKKLFRIFSLLNILFFATKEKNQKKSSLHLGPPVADFPRGSVFSGSVKNSSRFD